MGRDETEQGLDTASAESHNRRRCNLASQSLRLAYGEFAGYAAAWVDRSPALIIEDTMTGDDNSILIDCVADTITNRGH